MTQRFLVAASFLLGIILVFGIFNLQVDEVLWKGIFWTVFGLGLAVTLAVAGNLLWAMRTMCCGYPADQPERLSAESSPVVASVPSPDNDPNHDFANDVLLELCRAECALANVETSASLDALTHKQKRLYYHALKEVQELVLEISKHEVPDKVAS